MANIKQLIKDLIEYHISPSALKGFGVVWLLCGNMPAFGGNYTTAWKQLDEARKQDKPQTAITILHDIQSRAEKEKDYGNLLAAMVREIDVAREISPDSVKAAKERMTARQMAWQKSDGVLATLCRVVLQDEQGIPQLDSLLASKDVEAYTRKNATAEYRPFVEQGVSSAYFDNSLIGLIACHTGQEQALHYYYNTTGNRQAACIAAALWMEHSGTAEQTDSLITEFQNLPECGALAVRLLPKMHRNTAEEKVTRIDEALRKWPDWQENNELRNRRKELTAPGFRAIFTENIVSTDTEVMLQLERIRNIKGVKVTLRRKNSKAKGGYDSPRTLTKNIELKNDYDMSEDSLSLGRLPLGTWKVTVHDKDNRMAPANMELFVTDLRVLCLPLPAEKLRAVVVNAISGQPVPGATLHILSSGNKTRKTVVTDANGETVIEKGRSGISLYATKGADNAGIPVAIYGNYYYDGYRQPVRKRGSVFTDRSIYRPGQTVHVALTRYDISNDNDVKVAAGDTVMVTLLNTQYKEVEKMQVVTDEFGGASADFVLPKEGRSGSWFIVTDNATSSIRVEEYKRPTYDVTLVKPTIAYSNGDTVTVGGTARTYSGVPVANAKVVYRVNRKLQRWCYGVPWGSGELLRDTVMTAADGTFIVKMPMVMPEEAQGLRPYFYNIEAMVDVTDNAGESHSAVMSLPIGNKKAYLACEMGDKLLADSAMVVTPLRRNMAGLQIDGNVTMVLDGKTVAVVEANKPYTLAPDIASGAHTLMAICEGDTVKNDFVAFRKSDTVLMVNTHLWCYQSANRFPADGGEVWLQVGTSDKDVTVYYSVFSGERIIASGTTALSNSIITRSLTYKPEYGDGLTIAFAWVKDGQGYINTMSVEKPLPQKNLNMRWSTFRDRLVPGQNEQWAVTITNPDGTPANARMMAVLYDKSLEQLAKHSWKIDDMRQLRLPYTSWRFITGRPLYEWLSKKEVRLKVNNLQFSRIIGLSMLDGLLFNSVKGLEVIPKTRMMASGAMRLSGEVLSKNLEVKGMAIEDNVLKVSDLITTDEATSDTGTEQEAGDNILVRGDFAETAFFLPNVRTDAQGVATMTFTLPESVTTWRFMAVAHDDVMRNATLVADAVAQKPLMIQPNMPRFLRQGDNAAIATTVANMTEKDETVKVTMVIKDAQTERKITTVNRSVTVKAGETAVVTFPVEAAKVTEGEYICRFTAVGAGHTDGEQRMLMVLSDEEAVTNTMAYIFETPTDTLLKLADMIPKGVRKAHVKVDYVDNPAWLMMETLPQMAEPESTNAIVLSNALYANRVAATLKWTESKSENVLIALQQLQNADGSFSWWEGMDGSPYMTITVLKTLARLNTLCGRQEDTRRMMDRAFAYMQKEVDETVRKLRQLENKQSVSISPLLLNWLYALTLEQRKGGTSADWIVRHEAADMNKADMATKAVAAIVLYNNGKKTEARQYADAIKEHTVYRKDVGRYFDSYRAAYSWCDYRIPTQTLAIEALRAVTPQDSRTIGEMQQWLLSSKRTQEWDNACNTVNAVHTFFGGSMAVLKDVKGDTVLIDKEVEPKDATVRVRKQTDCESWAAAYVTFKQKARKINKGATGLDVSRTILFNGKEVTPGMVKVGDKVTVRIVVTADRDYDFVTIADKRAACLEPVNGRSGYTGSCYKEQKDNVTLCHFNKMAKGTHTVETEYYVDRAGDYSSGTVTAECAYANEFRGVEGAYKLNVK